MSEEKPTCEQLQEIIRKNKYEVVKVYEEEGKCIIDFKHPKVKVEPPVAYYLSSVVLDTFKELYLDYCCENSEQMCRPHVNMEEKILSVEARFWQNPKEKFSRLLDEMR